MSITELTADQKRIADAMADARYQIYRAYGMCSPMATAQLQAWNVIIAKMASEFDLDVNTFFEACRAPRCTDCGDREPNETGLCTQCEIANDL